MPTLTIDGITIDNLPPASAAFFTDNIPVSQGVTTFRETPLQLATLFGFDPTDHLLNVDAGGTGNSTFTAYSILCAGTTSVGPFQNVSGVGSAGQVLTSNGAGLLPTWQASAASGTVSPGLANQLGYYQTTGTTISGLTSANNGVLITSGVGIPSIGNTLPSLVQGNITAVGTLVTGAWNASIIGLAYGGTNANLAATASNGGIFYSNATAAAILAGTAMGGLALLSGSSTTPSWSSTKPLLTGGGVMSGNIAMGTNSITGMANPINSQDAATKIYVDQIATGGGEPCFAATTTALTVTQAGAGVGATLTNAGTQAVFTTDGQTPAVGSRILVIFQAAQSQNGIYILTNAGSVITNWVLTRATNYDTPSDINDTGLIPVINGTLYGSTGWYNTTTMVTVDATSVTFIQLTNISYPISLANGGTNANLAASASNGGIFYSTASAGAILAGTATAHQLLVSGANTTPQWTTTTYPLTNAANTLLYAVGSNQMAALATANNAVLITSGAGVPSIAFILPANVQGNITALGTIAQSVSISAASSGSNVTLTVANTSNTTNSASVVNVTVAGTSANNPVYLASVTGVQTYAWGISNSDSQSWHLSANSSLGTTDAIRVDSSGRLTYANQPRFLAYKSSSTTNALGNTATNYTIPFGSESYDIGSNYNTSTFTFTAPVSGYWNFIISFNMGNLGTAHTAMVYQLWKNGTTGFPIKYGNPGAMRDANNSLIVSGSRTIQLNATDTIQVQMQILNGTQVVTAAGDNLFTTSFAGILVA